jgi:hypothetical protein
MLAAVTRFAPPGSGAPPLRTTGFNVLFYFTLGACFAAIGVGSIRARRWARTLALVAGWIWLSTGVLCVVAVAFILPAALSAAGAPGVSAGCALAVAEVFLVAFLVALPLALVLFYRREDVRLTAEWRNPQPDWSDRVHPTLLGVVAAFAFGGVACVLAVPFLPAVPLFGSVLTGARAAVVLLVFAAISFLLAWGSWRRSRAAWWGLLALQVFALANFLTLRSLDVETYLRQSGYPEDQVRQAAAMNILGSPAMLWIAILGTAGLIAFIVAIRRHFAGPEPSRALPPG